MNARNLQDTRWSRRALMLAAIASLATLGACVGVGEYDPGYRTSGEISIGYGIGFYEPFGYGYGGYGDYGGWRNEYRVGPPRRGSYQRPPQSSPRRDVQSYQVAPHTRPIPSIPGNPRVPRPVGGNRGHRDGR
jgi:hypothetical protein